MSLRTFACTFVFPCLFALATAVAADPGDVPDPRVDDPVAVLDELAAQIHLEGSDEAADRLAELLAADPAERGAATSIVGSLRSADRVLPRLIALLPGDPSVPASLSQRSYGPIRAAWLALLADSPAAGNDPALRRWATAGRLAALLDAGLVEPALELLDALAPELRAALLRGGPTPAPPALPQFDEVEDLRPALAVASRVAGRDRDAAAIVAGLRRKPPPARDGTGSLQGLWSLLALADGPAADAFGRLAGGILDGSASSAVTRVFAAVARREGFPALERFYLASALGMARNAELLPPADAARVPAFREVFERLRDASLPLIARLRLEVASLAGSGAFGWDWPGPRGFEDLPGDLTWIDGPHPRPANRWVMAAATAPPEAPGLDRLLVLAAAGDGATRLAVVSLNPYSAAIQLFRSDDEGATWPPVAETGLRPFGPVVIRSQGVDLDGDRLSLEVDVWAPDPGGPTGEAHLGVARLDFSLAALTADGDGDGLADALEETLGTDPGEADSDGDELTDGEDRLPTVARRAVRSSEEAGLVFALDILFGLALKPDGPPLAFPIRLAVDGLSLAGREPPLAVVPVAESEPHDAEVRLFAVDAAGDRLLFLGGFLDSGVALEAHRGEDGWKVTRGSYSAGCFGYELDAEGRVVPWEEEMPESPSRPIGP